MQHIQHMQRQETPRKEPGFERGPTTALPAMRLAAVTLVCVCTVAAAVAARPDDQSPAAAQLELDLRECVRTSQPSLAPFLLACAF